MKIIDIHTHGFGGYDTRIDDAEHILAMAGLQGSLGVSEIIPSIYPAAIKVMRSHMSAVRTAMEKQNKNSRSAARISGVNLEGPFLNPTYSGALDSTSFIGPTERNLLRLIDGFEDIIKIMTIAPEMNGSEKIIKKVADRGIIASMGHSAATYGEAERGFKAGAKGITHIFNAMRGFHHREPGLAGFGLLNRDVYIEVIADPYHLHKETIDLIFKVKNPEKIIIVSDSVLASKITKETGGVVDSRGTLMGGAMSIVEAASRLVRMGFDRDVVTSCITKNPAKYLKTAGNRK
jgi:N-acetylglucosamine-6-phosphate deacetylase